MTDRKNLSGDTFRLIVNIVILVLGLILIARPNEAMQGIVIILGIILLVYGVCFVLFDIYKNRKGESSSGILIPVICLIIGIILLVFNSFFASILLPLVIGVWMIVMGIMYLISTGALKSARASSWGLSLGVALAAVILGIITIIGIFVNDEDVNVVGTLLGVCMMLFGIASVINWAAIYSAKRGNLL